MAKYIGQCLLAIILQTSSNVKCLDLAWPESARPPLTVTCQVEWLLGFGDTAFHQQVEKDFGPLGSNSTRPPRAPR